MTACTARHPALCVQFANAVHYDERIEQGMGHGHGPKNPAAALF
jgi:hypothetical protein